MKLTSCCKLLLAACVGTAYNTAEQRGESMDGVLAYNSFEPLNETGNASINAVNVARCLYNEVGPPFNYTYTETGAFIMVTNMTYEEKKKVQKNITKCYKYFGNGLRNLLVYTRDGKVSGVTVLGSEVADYENRSFSKNIGRQEE